MPGVVSSANRTIGAEIQGIGNITASTSSTSVTGASTHFTSGINVGDTIVTGSGTIGIVSSITNDTTLVLTTNSSTAVSGVFAYIDKTIKAGVDATTRIEGDVMKGYHAKVALEMSSSDAVTLQELYGAAVDVSLSLPGNTKTEG